MTENTSNAEFVRSLERGLKVILTFDAEHPELSLSEVSQRAEIPAAAARRFLRTLETLGYVRAEGRRFSLTPRVLELGFSYLSALSLPEVMQPHLEHLSREVGESVSSAVLSGSEIVYVARVATMRIMTVAITIGTRFPAYATSMGRVLLASLPNAAAEVLISEASPTPLTKLTLVDSAELLRELECVRAQGWAIVDQELEYGLRSIAVPVRARDGSVAAAINISTSTANSSVKELREYHLPLLRDAAEAIERDLRLL